ncbi:DUF1499 domain-containing protein [Hyphococcus sp.]|uniref:DUF1499 domain-containing protein n=1 Tax=Hyphococcus sp. TaxID=2038636 RepID=UPI00208196E7|nr:MAG: hypothetical protein DHS20C04_14440 [Marinicaulis sp.]
MKLLTLLLALAALGCAAAIAVAGPGTQMGWWTYGDGLSHIRTVSAPIEIGPIGLSPIFTLAAAAGLLGLISFFMSARSLGVFAIIAALAAAGAGQVPLKMRADFEANPFIHDITTNFDNPPPIIAGAGADRVNPPGYAGAELVRNSEKTVAQAQAEAFPDITTQKVNAGLDETAEIVRVIIADMGMELLDETLTDDGWLIEAAYTSRWFGFIDDFVVRISPEGSMSLVDVRSKSRVGGSDLGANARRVRAFFEKLHAATE